MVGNSEVIGRASIFDLTERTARFGENAIQFCLGIRLSPISSPLVSQLVRAATSVGANYGEADESATKKEFCYRISLCRRESKETKHWLRMLVAAEPSCKLAARELWKEANELTRIFAAIYRKAQSKSTKTTDPE
jgi:four helix bundle protein